MTGWEPEREGGGGGGGGGGGLVWETDDGKFCSGVGTPDVSLEKECQITEVL